MYSTGDTSPSGCERYCTVELVKGLVGGTVEWFWGKIILIICTHQPPNPLHSYLIGQYSRLPVLSNDPISGSECRIVSTEKKKKDRTKKMQVHIRDLGPS